MLNSVVSNPLTLIPEVRTYVILVTSKHFNHQATCCFCDIIWLPQHDIQY